jgi:hypothetical protein
VQRERPAVGRRLERLRVVAQALLTFGVTPIAELCAGLTVRGYDVRERQVAQIRLPPSRPCGPPLLRIFTSVP